MMKNSLHTSQTKAKAVALPMPNLALRCLKAALLTALVALVWILGSNAVWASGDQIVGAWLTPDDKAVVEIYQQEGEYFGKFVSLKEPTYAIGEVDGLDGQVKVDRKNPDASQHKQHIIGLVMLSGLKYVGEKKGKHSWKGGTIYDPSKGKTYKSTIKLNTDGTLDMRGYVGISLFGRTQVWRPQQ